MWENTVSRMRLFVVLCLLCLVCHGATLPNHFNEVHYYYGDTGSSIMATELMDRGATPWLDFNYYYGFATLWVNQAWYHVFGATPISNHLLNMLSRLLMAWAMADLMVVMGWNHSKPLLGLVLLSSPYLFCFLWFTLAHTTESALVILSISAAVRSRYTIALFWATLALLFKPALAYFVGLGLILLMLTSEATQPWPARLRLIAWWILPSLVLLLGYTGYVIMAYGVPVLLHSLLPLSAMKGYEEVAHGFFMQGSLFWLPRSGTPPHLLEHYLLTPAGLWLTGTIYLLLQSLLALLQWSASRTATPQQVCVVLCGGLHLAFILVLFGNEWSWLYEPYLLVFGVAAALSERREIPRYFLPTLTFVMLFSLVPTMRTSVRNWSTTRSYADRHYLFMAEEVHQELDQITRFATQHRLLLVTKQGAPGVLLPVQALPTWSYIRSPARDAERAGFREQMTQADIMVFPKHYFHMLQWSEVKEQLTRFQLVRTTSHFQYWVRPALAKEIMH